MRVDTQYRNPAFEQLLSDNAQLLFLDTNLLIAPDRSSVGLPGVPFAKFREAWLEPLFSTLDQIAIHESVYAELQDGKSLKFVEEMLQHTPPRLTIYRDDALDEKQCAVMNTYIDKIAVYTQYEPTRNNAKDRGEVLSLAYIATKGFNLFATNDDGAICLVKDADRFQTALQDIGIVSMYEMLYLMQRTGKHDTTGLKMMYKYNYYATPWEKKHNPAWGDFVESMNRLYSSNGA